jgi:hypothetical protein
MVDLDDEVIARLRREATGLEQCAEILLAGVLLSKGENGEAKGREAESLLQEANAKRQHARGLNHRAM